MSKTLDWKRAILLSVIGFLVQNASGQTIQAAQAERHLLPAVIGTRVTDGATAQSIIFRAQNYVVYYTSPFAWQAKGTEGKATLFNGRVTATLGLRGADDIRNSEAAPPTPAELKSFEQETLAKIANAEKSALLPLTILPFQAGGQALTASTVLYERAGQRYALQRVKKWGGAWQVELELSGPEQELFARSPEFLQSLCSIEVRGAAEQKSSAAEREQQAIANADEQRTAPSRSSNGDVKVRGRIR